MEINLRLGKRGVFYTAISLLIVSIMLLAFKSKPTEIASGRFDAEASRVEVANALVKNINEGFIERLLKVSSYRALNALALYINTTKDPIDPSELNDVFKEVLITGNISGKPIDEEIGIKIMENYTLVDNLRRLEEAAWEGLSIITRFNTTNSNVVVFQSNASGAFNVIVNLTLRYTVLAGTATWNVKKTWSVKVPIEGLYDPLWFKWEGRAIPIEFAEYEVDYAKNWTSLFKFIDNIDYMRQPYGPSYLMRLTGQYNLSSRCCGIESAVNPYYLNFTREYNRTYIDFCFYTVGKCAPYGVNKTLYELENITTHTPNTKFYGFKLDARHYVGFSAEKGSGTVGLKPSGKPSVGVIECEINTKNNWTQCDSAQWHTTILGTRAVCEHTDGYDKIIAAGFRLRNEDDDYTYFDVPNSTRLDGGVWYYNNTDVYINDSGTWTLRVRCEDRQGLVDARTESWFVPWGTANIIFINQSGNITAIINCTGGECDEINITLE
ncbi:hypothetical protein DRJ48_02375 [Candidatus Woesearchaeota archaeon]|nr:hypothetical protein [Candidatus Woesearchaeota archaeon]RLE42930.1 MAG: hypothetical protein DRJ48_02375 [Candidatus Woesearchaeota archaeon]